MPLPPLHKDLLTLDAEQAVTRITAWLRDQLKTCKVTNTSARLPAQIGQG